MIDFGEKKYMEKSKYEHDTSLQCKCSHTEQHT